MDTFFLNENGVFVDTATESVAHVSYMLHKENIYYLVSLKVMKPYRNLGLAKKLLTAVCSKMDSMNSVVWLDFVPSPEMDAFRLEQLYNSFGFLKRPDNTFVRNIISSL